jgi:hypothetical protein
MREIFGIEAINMCMLDVLRRMKLDNDMVQIFFQLYRTCIICVSSCLLIYLIDIQMNHEKNATTPNDMHSQGIRFTK